MAQQPLTKQKYKWPLKIIHAGQIRTGSASLSVALDKLGYGAVQHFITNEFNAPERTEFAWNWYYENLPKLDNGQDINWDEFFEQAGVYSALDAPIYIYWEDMIHLKTGRAYLMNYLFLILYLLWLK